MTLTMDELIAQGYCFYIGKTVVKPDLCFCTIRDKSGETVSQARAMTAAEAQARAIALMIGGKSAAPAHSEPTTVRVKPAMPMPAPRTMPGMPKPKGAN
jgi:hypothetical protein